MSETNELTREDIVVDREMEVSDDGRHLSVYLETWFDVDKKFGIHSADSDDTWVNMYAIFDIANDVLKIECIVSKPDMEDSFGYTPTANEAALIKGLIREKCLQEHGCTVEQYIADAINGESDAGHEAQMRLLGRLDECLAESAISIAKGPERPAIKDIYEIEDLSKLHYYLKTQHEFTPSEVEALLRFKDPLNVLRWCKEEHPHTHSFPICRLLKEINAYARFEQITPAEKTSVRERLEDAAREVDSRPSKDMKPYKAEKGR